MCVVIYLSFIKRYSILMLKKFQLSSFVSYCESNDKLYLSNQINAMEEQTKLIANP